jgi:hypothetical protein
MKLKVADVLHYSDPPSDVQLADPRPAHAFQSNARAAAAQLVGPSAAHALQSNPRAADAQQFSFNNFAAGKRLHTRNFN